MMMKTYVSDKKISISGDELDTNWVIYYVFKFLDVIYHDLFFIFII